MSIKNNLEKNHTYLIKHVSSYGSLISITILLVTEKAYHICWNNGLSSSNTWELIDKIKYEYDLIEDITELVNDTTKYNFDDLVLSRVDVLSKYFLNPIPCPTCNGDGLVLDNASTSGYKQCPTCFGSKSVID